VTPGAFDVAKAFPTAPASFYPIVRDLIRRNPGWDPTRLSIKVVDGHIDEFVIRGENLVDVTPVSSLERMTFFDATNTTLADIRPLVNAPLIRLAVVGTKVSDLSPIADKQTLNVLWCGSSQVTDLAPIQNLRNLTNLSCSRTDVSSLEPVRGLKAISNLDLAFSKVSDLSPVANLPIHYLNVAGTGVRDLTPIGTFKGLKHVVVDVLPGVSLDPLRGLKELEKINERSPAQFWAQPR
jgi:internalin A